MNEDIDIVEFIKFACKHFGIELLSHDDKYFNLEKGYKIEIESRSLFKLSYNETVIAPFGSVDEMFAFLKEDMALSSQA